jgi:regulator of protease activity HflC (stomatin/prohibitin superfamily)
VFVNIEANIQFKVIDPEKYFYQLTDPRSQMTSYVFSVIRSLIPDLVLDDVFTSKNDLGESIEKQLKENFETFGILIIGAPIT